MSILLNVKLHMYAMKIREAEKEYRESYKMKFLEQSEIFQVLKS